MKAALLDFCVWVLGLLPARMVYWLSYPLGRLTWVASATRRGTTLRNLQAAYPDMPDPQRRRLAQESMRHFALGILEIGMSWTWRHARLMQCFDAPEGWDVLEQALQHGQGVLLLVPHFGAWELSGQWLQPRHPTMALYKPGASPTVERRMLERRQRFGLRMAATDIRGLKSIYQALAGQGVVIQLPDQNPSLGQGRFVPFFGVPALTGVLAPRLVQSTGCRVVFAVCRRSAPGRFRMHFLPAAAAVYAADLEESLAAINRGVEACIAVDPAQYLWAYKRYKTRPDGEARFY
jgi:KDO2-lipid IV(A) lauroyltransferase